MKQHQPVRQQRKLKNQSQKQVYTAIGMAQQTYSNKERGLHKFTRDELELIARHLGVDVSVFDEQPPATPCHPRTQSRAECNRDIGSSAERPHIFAQRALRNITAAYQTRKRTRRRKEEESPKAGKEKEEEEVKEKHASYRGGGPVGAKEFGLDIKEVKFAIKYCSYSYARKITIQN